MPRVFSGIQPTGEIHLGNYLGAVQHWVTAQDASVAPDQTLYCVVDLHGLTLPWDTTTYADATRRTAMLLLASGLDPERCTLFVQSHVHEHTDLTWLLNCIATFGELNRMTQFKEKSEGRESVSVGLFDYPVLMAADVLAYDTERVPVGDDQRQHLELARDIAQRFNSRYGEFLTLPEAAIPGTGGRVMDLQDPTRKMSTTRGTPQGTVLVTDSTDIVTRKIRSAVTDSGREVHRGGEGKEGIANLIEIMAVATDRTADEIEQSYDGAGYGQFKTDVAEAVEAMIGPVRERYLELRADEAHVLDVLSAGAAQAQAIAAPTLAEMKRRMGFI